MHCVILSLIRIFETLVKTFILSSPQQSCGVFIKKKYTVFLDAEDPPRAYGVLGLYTHLKGLIDSSNLPAFVKAVLLPFENKIVYDGILAPYNIIIGKGISRGFDDQ